MVVTDVEHMAEQAAMTPSLWKVLAFLKNLGSRDLADGRIDIDGDRVYVMVQSYETIVPKGEPQLEAHKRYIDVQYMLSGEEVLGWALTYRMHETMAYDTVKDVWLGTVPLQDFTPVRLSAGQAAILYPTDGHAPRLAAGSPSQVKKLVFKVAV